MPRRRARFSKNLCITLGSPWLSSRSGFVGESAIQLGFERGEPLREPDILLAGGLRHGPHGLEFLTTDQDRKSTRLNSSHVKISYAVFCLKKKNHPNPPFPSN